MIEPLEQRPGLARLEVESRAEQVTFFEDRAEVRRRAQASVPAGTCWVVVAGVSTAVDDASVVAGVRGERARTLAARVVRRVVRETAARASELAALERELLDARARRQQVELALGRAEAERGRAEALADGWARAVWRVPRDGQSSVPACRTAYAALEQAELRALDEWGARRGELRKLELEERQLAARLEQGRALVPRFEAAVEVQVEAQEPHAAELELTYRVPCALWRPEHLARLERGEGGKATVRLRTWATVWQRTGEEWRDLTCRFSTARPARSASAPNLTEDLLHARRKAPEERRQVVVEARDQVITAAGLGRGARQLDEMPGVDDGGEPLTFTASRPATIPGDGQPFRVELEELELAAEAEVVAFPERSPAAYVRATCSLKSRHPLLAGPVWVARGTEMVGRAKLDFVPAGEPFELGFGSDDGLRVRRTQAESRDTVPVIGTQKLSRTVTVFLSNLSGAAKRLTVTERIPVSELADVKVEVTSAEGARPERTDGFVRFDVEVGPNATRELRLEYRIEAAAKVRLPF